MMVNKSRFNVIIAYNNLDCELAIKLERRLQSRGVKVWLDLEQVPPGRSFQEFIEQSIGEAASAAILVGKTGLGKWQMIELQSLLREYVERGLPVIPVLLPGVPELPANLRFLCQFNWVSFKESLDESAALDRLIWGITGSRPITKPVSPG